MSTRLIVCKNCGRTRERRLDGKDYQYCSRKCSYTQRKGWADDLLSSMARVGACWIWTKARSSKGRYGYGRICRTVNGKKEWRSAHRVSYDVA